MSHNPKELKFRVKKKLDGYYYPQHKHPRQLFWNYFWDKLNFMVGIKHKFTTHNEADIWLQDAKSRLGV